MPDSGAVDEGVDALGAYHLVRLLGTGGMASVWHAVDARDGRQVALKRMLPRIAYDPEETRAFQDEAALGLRLRHGNIVTTLDFGETHTARGLERYLVLELLSGRSLHAILRAAAGRDASLPLGVVIRIVRDAARGLEHAHHLADADDKLLDFVHRDVSPENLFVCTSGTTKLIDFGVARANSQSHRTEPGAVKGKLGYLAPEQLRGRPLDGRVDVFALGVVLWELITGEPLFRGGTEAEVMYRLMSGEIPSPDTIRPSVPAALSAVALRALQRDRDRRLPSCAAMAEALDAVAVTYGFDTSSDAVAGALATLFPDDLALHAERAEAGRKLYAHLGASLTPVVRPLRSVPRARRKPGRARTVAASALLSFAAFAAVGATQLFAPRHREPAPVPISSASPSPVATPSPSAPPPVELPAPTAPATKPTHRKWKPDGCVVYISIQGGVKRDCSHKKR